MRYSKPVIIDSHTGEEVSEEEVHEVTMVFRQEALTLDLSPASYQKLIKALQPFLGEEEWRPARVTYSRSTGTPKRKTSKPQPTREERAAIAKFVEETGLGTVSMGRAGPPGLHRRMGGSRPTGSLTPAAGGLTLYCRQWLLLRLVPGLPGLLEAALLLLGCQPRPLLLALALGQPLLDGVLHTSL